MVLLDLEMNLKQNEQEYGEILETGSRITHGGYCRFIEAFRKDQSYVLSWPPSRLKKSRY